MPNVNTPSQPTTTNAQQSGQSSYTVSRSPVEEFIIYEITETHLYKLKEGRSDSLYLAFSTFLISAAISFGTVLATTKIDDIKTYLSFLVVTIVGTVLGLLLFLVWIRKYLTNKDVLEEIQSRRIVKQMLTATFESQLPPASNTPPAQLPSAQP